MAILKIKKYPDPILRKKCQEVKKITSEIRDMIEKMEKIVEKDYGVAGLAAPQIGISKRIIVVDTEKGPVTFINPKIVKKTEETNFDWEGCLSIPGIFLKIKRWNGVEIEALDKEGEKVKVKAVGFLARVFQDEIDHLDGILIIDRVGFWQRLKIKRQLQKFKPQ